VTSCSLNFKLKGAGWADLEIVVGDSTTVIDAISYCTNALGDLVRMGIDIATDKGFGATIFDHEPALSVLVAETAWLEQNTWGRGARLSVVRNLPNPPEASFKWRASVEADAVFDVGSRDELARLFLDMALRVRQEHGEEGYQRLWGRQFSFPRRAVAALEAALNCPEPSANLGA
jgi:hypothetical protein